MGGPRQVPRLPPFKHTTVCISHKETAPSGEMVHFSTFNRNITFYCKSLKTLPNRLQMNRIKFYLKNM